MPDPVFPGVYINEAPDSQTITPSIQSRPLFIAYTPVKAAVNPVLIHSLTEFDAQFPVPKPARRIFTEKFGVKKALPVKKIQAAAPVLRDHLELYFANGGGACYLFSCGTAEADKQKQHYLDALAALPADDSFDLLVLPDAADLPTDDYAEVLNAAVGCAVRLDVFYIADICRAHAGLTISAAVSAFRNSVTNMSSLKNTAVYFPWLKTGGRLVKTLPPSAAIAAVYVQTDQARGIWKAPVNVAIAGITDLTKRPGASDQDEMNIDTEKGLSVNAIRFFTGKGFLVWGARTLAGNDNEWRYVSVRRLALWIRKSVALSTEWVIFEPNNASTWTKLKGCTEAFLIALWRQGAFAGAKPGHAFYVRSGLNETMTQADIQNGRLIIEIGIAPVRPAEFIILRIAFPLFPG
ncbi:MAG: phage tail sheath family protein [Mucilaginibacter polytrichastri]|nr:phage tail sheath family protein [Mucilaginibacter polytrichastri]